MKLILFLLVLAVAGLFFHDRQQMADLATAQDTNADLTKQLSDKSAQVTALQAKVQQLTAQIAAAPVSVSRPTQAVGTAAVPAPTPDWRLKELSNPLDKPAYRH